MNKWTRNNWILILLTVAFVITAAVFYSQGWRIDIILWHTVTPEDLLPLTGVNG